MKRLEIRKWLVHLVAVGTFLALSYGYFAPLLTGKVVEQHDRDQWHGTARELIEYYQEHGESSHWTSTVFGGMPSVLISLYYPNSVISWVDSVLLTGQRPASYIFLTMLGFYILLVVMGVNPWLSLGGAVAYGLSTYFFIIVGAGHNAKSHAICYMAPMLLGMVLAYRGRYVLGGALFALFVALSLVAGHLQITYYTGFILAAVGIGYLVEAVRTREFMRFSWATLALLVGLLVAVGANFNRMYQTWDYGRESIRSATELTQEEGERTGGLDRSYATAWSYGKAETMNLFIPNFVGGASGMPLDEDSHVADFLRKSGVRPGQLDSFLASMPVYWGAQPMTSGPVYLGAVVVFLFVLSLFLLRGPVRWALLAVTGLSVVLAWGKNFPWLTDLFFDYFPGYNKFRTVSMTLVIAELTLPLLAFLGLSRWLSGEEDARRKRRALIWATALSGGVALVIALLGPVVGDFTSPSDAGMLAGGFPQALMESLRADRAALLRADAFRSLIFVLLTAGLLLVRSRERISARYFALGLAALIVIDLLPVDKRYDGVRYQDARHNQEQPFEMTAADRAILADTSYFRVLNASVSPFNDASTSFYHRSLGGYHGAKLRIFQDFIDHYGHERLMYNLMNVRYVIAPGQGGERVVQQNPQAYGSCWFVDSIVRPSSADAEMQALGAHDLRRVALVRDSQPLGNDFLAPGPGDSVQGEIQLVAHEPNRMCYRSRSSRAGFAVFSEIFYPRGWTATIDGEPASILRANYLLRGLEVPAGEHEIEFRFELPYFALGQWVDLGFGLAILLVLLVLVSRAIYRGYRAKSSLQKVPEV